MATESNSTIRTFAVDLVGREIEELRRIMQEKNDACRKAHADAGLPFRPFDLNDTAMLLLSDLLISRAILRAAITKEGKS
jgi:hypothetical protein